MIVHFFTRVGVPRIFHEEFPCLSHLPYKNQAIASPWEINVLMMQLLMSAMLIDFIVVSKNR